jgi:hypothetical protein
MSKDRHAHAFEQHHLAREYRCGKKVVRSHGYAGC